ncbi:hypothetical protein [Pseudonocardia sp.]|jgi:hypothetical protein|uniref:hypothetical protein n=1 Tax=Pseudonocardia sp. TaxID=60912 RepID=UPI003D0B2562
MSIFAKSAAVLATAVALTGIGAGVALASTPADSPAPAATSSATAQNLTFVKGFDFVDMDPTPGMSLEYTGATSNYIGALDSGPAIGTTIGDGQSFQAFDVTWFAGKTDTVTAHFQEVDGQGVPTGRSIDVNMSVDMWNTPSMSLANENGLTNTVQGDNTTCDIS